VNRRRSDVIVGVVIVGVFLLILWFAFGSFSSQRDRSVNLGGRGNIALVKVQGMIADPQQIIDDLQRYSDRKDIKAIVLRIESPGGVVAASQELYDAVKRVRDTEKPIIVSMGSLAASGGYYVALGADSILANPGTLTGSIGVLMDFPEMTKLLDKIGVQVHSVTSGSLKDAGAPFKEWSPEVEAYFKDVVTNSYDQFVTVVAKERKLEITRVRELASGRVYTGAQALENGLIDKLGGQYEAVHLAAKMAGIEGKPQLVEPSRQHIRLWDVLFGDMERAMNRVLPIPLLEYRMSFN